MHYQTPYAIPESAPPDALAELDAAAQALDALSLRAAQLTLGMDEQTRTVRIELTDGSGASTLSPTQLFALLGSA